MVLTSLQDGKKHQNFQLATEVIVRQSCGCLSPAIKRVQEIKPVTLVGGGTCDLTVQYETIQRALRQEIENFPDTESPKTLNKAIQLFDAFYAEVISGNLGEFLNKFNTIIQEAIEKGGNLDLFNEILSVLRAQILKHCADDREVIRQLETLWQQARILLSDIAHQAQVHQRLQGDLLSHLIFEINENVIKTFDLPKLMEALSDALKQLDISFGYLCLYDDQVATNGLEKIPPWSRLIFAFTQGEKLNLEPEGVRFPTAQFLPDEVLPRDQRHDMVVLSLRFQNHYLGYAVFEMGDHDGFVYDALQIQISSAIQGASLIQQLSEAQSELELWVEERTEELQKEIVERSRVEETLRKNEQRYQALFEQTTDAVFLFDFDTKHIMVNQKAADMLGYTIEELLEFSGGKVLAPDEKGDAQNKLEMALQRQPVPLYERNLIHRDGHLIPVEINLLLVTDIDGNPLHFQSVVRDITQRKRREQLTEAFNQASLAMRNSLTPENIFEAVGYELKTMGFECTIFRTNQDLSKITPAYYSYDSEVVAIVEKMINVNPRKFAIPIENVEIFRKTIWDQEPQIILDPDEAISQLLPQPTEGLSKKIVHLLDVGSSINAPLIVTEQTIGMFTIQANDLLEEDIPMVMAFADQIAASWQKARLMQELELSLNEQLLIEESLRRSEQKFRTLFELSPEAIILVGLNGIVLDVNQAVEQIFDRKKNEIIGQPFLDLGFWDEDQQFLPGYNELFSQAIRSNRPGPIELQLNIRETETLWIEVHPALLKEGTDILALQLIIQDITDRRKAEQALVKSEEQFRSIFENAVMGIYRSTPDGQIITANPAMIQMLGYSSFDELIQQDLNLIRNRSYSSRQI